MKIGGGELVARTLARAGVTKIFALHGGHIDPIFQGCYDAGIQIVDTRHEQAAGHMADAWARLTRTPGVAVVTAGPGLTDIVTAVANAHVDCVPMLVIAGRHPLADDERLPLQELHGLPLMESITKWARLVSDTARIPEYLSAALRHARSARPGPVFLEIPADVLAASVEEERVVFPEVSRAASAPAPPREAAEKAIDILLAAERPVILAGRGVWFAGAERDLREFAELTQIPVCGNGIVRGAVPEGTPLGPGGFMTAGRALALGAEPDAVLLLGGRLGLFTGGRHSIVPRGARLIQVDIEAEEIGRARDVDLGIAADCRETLKAFIEVARGRSLPDRDRWLAQAGHAAAAVQAAFAPLRDPARMPIHPYRLALDVMQAVGERGVLVVDGGETFVWAEMALVAQSPGRYLGHGYLGCLGTGLPFALSAKLARPDEAVVLLTGDGSIGLNFAEFDTAVRHGLPIVCVVNNDQAWGMCKHEQVVRLGRERVVGTELGATRYEKAAEAFGVYGQLVERPEEIRPALDRALASGRPACINVMTDPDAVSPAVQQEALVGAASA